MDEKVVVVNEIDNHDDMPVDDNEFEQEEDAPQQEVIRAAVKPRNVFAGRKRAGLRIDNPQPTSKPPLQP